MTDLDRTLFRLIGEEADRQGDVTPPPLSELSARAAGRRRRRITTLALGAAAAGVLLVTLVQLRPEGSGAANTTVPAAAQEGDRYDVPTFTWDPDQGGHAALLEGTISMTGDGCAVVVSDLEPRRTGVILPNAYGVHLTDNQTALYSSFSFPRGEVLMAQDGMHISYGGGGSGAHEDWSRLCPDSPVDHIFWVYDTAP